MCARVITCLILPWDGLKQKQKKWTIHALRELAPFACVVTVDGGRRACLPRLIVSCAGAYAI